MAYATSVWKRVYVCLKEKKTLLDVRTDIKSMTLYKFNTVVLLSAVAQKIILNTTYNMYLSVV